MESAVNEFELANDAMNSEWYKVQGVQLMLPGNYECAKQPEWRLAHFALVLPVPELPSDLEWPNGWLPGRFRGIKKVEFAGISETSSTYCSFMQAPTPDYSYAPRVFHKGATSYFREPVAGSMGAAALDASVRAGGQSGQWSTDRATNPVSVEAHRFLFEPDLTAEPQTPPSVPTHPLRFSLQDDSSHPYSSLRFLCAELISYSGPHLYDLASDEPASFFQNFLVVHLAAEHCSSATLEKINSSLTKPREKLTLRPPHGAQEWDDHQKNVFGALPSEKPGSSRRTAGIKGDDAVDGPVLTTSLLHLAVSAVMRNLFGETVAPWQVASGGYIKPVATAKNRKQSNKPYCVTMAIPGGRELELPQPIQQGSGDEHPSWTLHDKWAWYLASRFDQYITDIPDFSADTVHDTQVTRHRDWTIHSCEEGLALVRRSPMENTQNSFIMLAGTRFVDVAIFSRRAKNYLARIGEQMRHLSFGPEALNVLDQPDNSYSSPDSLLDMREADRRLQESLRDFAKIQAEFVYLRDHLWYERIPGREVATTILQHMLDKTGTRRDFDDIADELNLRKNVYSTQYNFARIRLDGIEAEDRRRKQELRDERNVFLALAAAILAIPGLFALLPNAESWPVFSLCTLIVVILAGAAYLRHRQRENDLTGRKNQV